MKKLLIVLGFLMLQLPFLTAQYVVKSESELAQLKKLPLEKVFVHYNTSTVFPGEYIYYSVYCINALTSKLSNISQMVYIEVVGENLVPVFTQKVRLEGGKGQGDFFIPVSVPSGNYKLVAYTQWMKNAGQEQAFKDDMAIVNPYRVDQEAILISEDPENANDDEGLVGMATAHVALKNDGTLVLETDRKTYAKRDKVSLVPRNYKGPLGYGEYSISVRLKDELSSGQPKNAHEFSMEYLNATKILPRRVNDSIYLPEQRGELFYGTVTTTAGNTPVAGKTVVISIPGEDFQLKSAITDKDGNFYTYVRKEYSAQQLLAQVMDNRNNEYKIQLKKKGNLNYKGLTFGKYTISPEMKESILSRSIHNQIENGYYSVKPDSILAINEKDPFDGGVPVVINLDEFTRFKTLRETLVEVVPNVWVTKKEDGNYTFWVKEDVESYVDEYASDPPLVLIDGVFVPDHNELLEYNARTLKKLSILRDPLVMGSKKYHGMVVMETIDGDYLERVPNAPIARHDLLLPTAKKNYFRQRYDEKTASSSTRIPDFRYQLFWEPQVSINGEEVAFEFYTSDVPGEYEIVLEGFTTYGKPISVRESITVE